MNNDFEEYYEFLDGLRESGITNMYGAVPYIVKNFGISKEDAAVILTNWMSTFKERHND